MNGKIIDFKSCKKETIGRDNNIYTPVFYFNGKSKPLNMLVSNEQLDYICQSFNGYVSSSLSDEYFRCIETLDGAYVTLNFSHVCAIHFLVDKYFVPHEPEEYEGRTIFGLHKNNNILEISTFNKREEMDCHQLLESGDNTYPFLHITDEDNELLVVRKSEIAYMISDIKITEEEIVND